MVAYAFNPSTQEAEAGRFLSSRPAWVYRVSYRKTKPNQTKPNQTKKKKKKVRGNLWGATATSIGYLGVLSLIDKRI
jgi:hypothetical protein